MSSFDIESNFCPDGFNEIEEGVYFKHYGMDMLDKDIPRGEIEASSFGCFEEKSLLWQKQVDVNGDSIALKSIIESSFKKEDIDQNRIMKECTERGLFQKHCGSSFDDFVEILNMNLSDDSKNTFTVDVASNSGLLELTDCVESDEEVICYVNMMLLDYDGNYSFRGLNSDGLVHVIGICFSDTDGDYVIINDVEKEYGAGKKIELDKFLKSWSTSDYTAITVAWR